MAATRSGPQGGYPGPALGSGPTGPGARPTNLGTNPASEEPAETPHPLQPTRAQPADANRMTTVTRPG